MRAFERRLGPRLKKKKVTNAWEALSQAVSCCRSFVVQAEPIRSGRTSGSTAKERFQAQLQGEVSRCQIDIVELITNNVLRRNWDLLVLSSSSHGHAEKSPPAFGSHALRLCHPQSPRRRKTTSNGVLEEPAKEVDAFEDVAEGRVKPKPRVATA